MDRNVRDRLRDIGEARVVLQNPAAAAPVESEWKRSVLPWILCGGLALIAAVLWLRGPGPAQTQAYRYSMENRVPVFSPDGRWMVEAPGSALRVRANNGGDWLTLPGTDPANTPFWSPDSSAIGFFSGGRLKTISVDGANLRNLAAAPYEGGGTWHGGASDGSIVFATNGKLRRYDFTTREERELAIQIPGGRRADRPRFLPEGDGFVFEGGGKQIYRSSLSAVAGAAELVMDDATYVSFGRHPRSGAWHIFYAVNDVNVDGWSGWTAKIDPRTGVRAGSPVKLVTHLTSNRGSTLPESPSGYMGFQAGANGAISWRRGSTAASIYRLRWFDRDGKVLSTFADLGRYMELALSPDETRVAVVQGEPGAEIWIYHTQRGTGVLLTTEAGRKYETLWSPDGKYVYYMLISDSNQSVVRRVAEGGGTPEVLYQIDGDPTMHVKELTPDGKYVILQSSKGIFRLSTGESGDARKLDLLLDASSGFRGAEFIRMTRDGRWLVCSGGGDTYVVPYPLGGKAVSLRSGLAGQPFFSADGRTAFGAGGRAGDRALTMQSIVSDPGGAGIRFGERLPLFPILTPGRVGANVAAVSRDGMRILAISTDDAEALKTQVLTDWTALLPTGSK